MRTGASSLQQALTAEAASIVKQSILLAKRRGHAQVTPLHVASTMLSSSTGLLRTACMQSHSHPLQCKALELCFNVALNRLPATTTTTTTNGHSHLHQHPSLSNALVAAFKRAQAHQRRGSIENQQQQPLLAVKVELEQLIVSILDDPSVSRVMREAGFSSVQVKNNVELAVSIEMTSSNCSLSKQKETNLGLPILSSGLKRFPFSGLESANVADVSTLVDNLLSRRKKCTAIVGESLETAENVVKGLVIKIDKGEIHDRLNGAQFITLPLSPYVHSSIEDVQQKLRELRCALKSCISRGVLLYVGDLKWAAEFNNGDQRRKYFCPIDLIVFEVGRLVSEFIESERFWLLGIASYQTFMRCRMGNPSLESLWRLQPLTVPAGSLELSLNPESDLLDKGRDDVFEKSLTCCSDCLSKFEMDVQRSVRTIHGSSSRSQLPSWLQKCKDEKIISASNNLDQFQIRKLLEKWNDICNSIHKQQPQSENTMSFYFHSPPSSSKLPPIWPRSEQASPIDSWGQNHLCISDKETSILEIPSSNSSPHSTVERDYHGKFKQFNAENLKILCHALEQKAPQHKDIISEIASVVLQCRSGMMRRKGVNAVRERKEDTWLLFEGGDTENKESIARELANQVFCHESSFLFIGSGSFSSLGSEDQNRTRKRRRQELRFSYVDKLSEAIVHNPHRVIFLEGVDQVDYHTQVCVRRAMERGVVVGPDGCEISLRDAIIILSSEGFVSTSRASSPCVKQKSESNNGGEEGSEKDDNGASPCISLDLNLSVEDNESMEQCCEVELEQYVDRSFVLDTNGRAETRVSS